MVARSVFFDFRGDTPHDEAELLEFVDGQLAEALSDLGNFQSPEELPRHAL
jgi:hypothetical protein